MSQQLDELKKAIQEGKTVRIQVEDAESLPQLWHPPGGDVVNAPLSFKPLLQSHHHLGSTESGSCEGCPRNR